MYFKITEMSIKNYFAYRVELLGGLINSFISLIVLWFVWNAIFASGSIEGITLPAMITYVAISAILRTYGYFGLEFEIEDDVRTGSIANYLVRPFKYPLYCLFQQFGNLLGTLAIVTIPMIVIGFFLLNISMPANLIAFLVSAILGFFLSFLISFLTGMWSFWTKGSIWGLRMARYVFSDLFSGAIIPLFLFPAWLMNIAYLFPFQAMYNTPLLIYIGKTTGFDILNGILIQIFWLAILSTITYFVWKRAESKTVVHGG